MGRWSFQGLFEVAPPRGTRSADGHAARARKDLEHLYAADPGYRDVRKRLGL